MGKYTQILEGKAKWFGSDASQQEKVQEFRTELSAAFEKRERSAELPKFVEYTDKYRLAGEAIQALSDAMTFDEPPTPTRLAALYIEARTANEAVESLFKRSSRLLEAVEQMLSDAYDAEDVANLGLTSGDKIRIDKEPHLVVSDKEKFRKWCVENGLEQKLELHWGTANALLKERLSNGFTEMDGCEFRSKDKFVWTKSDERKAREKK